METIKDRDMIVYYHGGREDLLREEKTFKEEAIGTGYFDNSPVRICPRPDNSNEYEFIWHVLLLNTGNRKNDWITLNKALAKFNREFRGGL